MLRPRGLLGGFQLVSSSLFLLMLCPKISPARQAKAARPVQHVSIVACMFAQLSSQLPASGMRLAEGSRMFATRFSLIVWSGWHGHSDKHGGL